MSRHRYSLPEERPHGVTDHDGGRSCIWLFGCLLIPPVLGYVWRGATFGDWGWGAVGFLISMGFAWFVSHGLTSRRMECNSGVYTRLNQPVRYWGVMLVWVVAYLMSVSAFVLVHVSAAGGIHR